MHFPITKDIERIKKLVDLRIGEILDQKKKQYGSRDIISSNIRKAKTVLPERKMYPGKLILPYGRKFG
jgi:hypothetical protein